MTVTLDLGALDRDDLLAAIRELDREEGARRACYPKLVAQGRLTDETAMARFLAFATAREIVAVVARAMIGASGKVLQVLPVLPVAEDAATDCADELGGEA